MTAAWDRRGATALRMLTAGAIAATCGARLREPVMEPVLRLASVLLARLVASLVLGLVRVLVLARVKP